MNSGAFGLPAQRVGLVPLGTKSALGAFVQWKNVPPGVRRLNLLLNRVSGSAAAQFRLSVSPHDTILSASYLEVHTNLAAATIASAQETVGFIVGNVAAGADAVVGLLTLMRDDFNNWVLFGGTNQFNLPGNWISIGASPIIAQDIKMLDIRPTAGVFDGGTFSLFAEFDAPTT
jgi:hypothetical protein